MNSAAQIIRSTYVGDKKEEGDALGKSFQGLTTTVKNMIKELDLNVLLLK